VTSSSKHYTPFIKAIGIPSYPSFGIKLTSFGKECIGKKPQLPIHGATISISAHAYLEEKRNKRHP
jgi:hypothetical protein